MIAINLIIAALFVWMVMYVNAKFIQPALWDEHRFKLFALRDELAIMAMEGKVNQNDQAYKNIIGLINTTVHETQEFRLQQFILFLNQMSKSPRLKIELISILEQLKNSGNHYCIIMDKYYQIVENMFSRQLRLYIITLIVLGVLISYFNKKLEFIRSIKKNIQQNHEMIRDLCPCHYF